MLVKKATASLLRGDSKPFVITLRSMSNLSSEEKFEAKKRDWKNNQRWRGIQRPYSPKELDKLSGSINLEYTLADSGSRKLWKYFNELPYVNALGAVTGNQAMQQVKAGLKTIYVSGWQVAADANLSGEMYPDQSLYPSNSVPNLVRNINRCLQRADQIAHSEGDDSVDWFAPLIADAEAGFGGVLNAFEITKMMIEAGAAAVHFEDQLSSAKKCGHMGGKVLVPTREACDKLIAARLAADVMNVPTVLIARTDAQCAGLLTNDIDPSDRKFCNGKRTPEGFFETTPGLDMCVERALNYAPFADLLWCETSTPDIVFARRFAEAIHHHFPGKPLAYNCSPSFNWKKNLSDREIADFQKDIGKLGYKFQFITLAGFHSLNYGMFDLSRHYARAGMPAFVELQEKELIAQDYGFTAVKHQREVGTGYFDSVVDVIQQGLSSTTALKGSTEEAQFEEGENAEITSKVNRS